MPQPLVYSPGTISGTYCVILTLETSGVWSTNTNTQVRSSDRHMVPNLFNRKYMVGGLFVDSSFKQNRFCCIQQDRKNTLHTTSAFHGTSSDNNYQDHNFLFDHVNFCNY